MLMNKIYILCIKKMKKKLTLFLFGVYTLIAMLF